MLNPEQITAHMLALQLGPQAHQLAQTRYRITRDPLQGQQRTLFWLAAFENDIPSNWWTS